MGVSMSMLTFYTQLFLTTGVLGVAVSLAVMKSRLLYPSYPSGSPTEGAVLVTGVSSGLGRSIALLLAQKGWTVLGTVRKEADAKIVRDLKIPGFSPILLDVTIESSVAEGMREVQKFLQENGLKLSGLVNNAGVNPEAEVWREDDGNLSWPLGAKESEFTIMST